MEEIYMGIIVSSMCTIVGAVPAMFLRNLSHRIKDNLLAYTAGIMVAAATYGLIPSVLKISNLYILTAGIILGTIALTLLDTYMPHVDLEHSPHTSTSSFQTSASLLMAAMALHNIPEGLSVGVSYASGYQDLGPLVSFAIGLQNAPEGFLIALFLISHRLNPFKIILFVTITGLIELTASILGLHFAKFFFPLFHMGWHLLQGQCYSLYIKN